MAQDVFSGYPCRLVHGGGHLDLVQLRGVDKRPGRQLSEVIAGGDLDRKAVVLSHADPQILITTADLTTVLGTLAAATGLKITNTSTFRLQKRDSGGAFDTGNNHVSVTIPAGFCAISSISARQDDLMGAVCELGVWPHSSDGLADPISVATGQAIAAPAPAFSSQFYLGPVYLGATELEGVIGSEVNYGIQYQLVRASGDPFARKGLLCAADPWCGSRLTRSPTSPAPTSSTRRSTATT